MGCARFFRERALVHVRAYPWQDEGDLCDGAGNAATGDDNHTPSMPATHPSYRRRLFVGRFFLGLLDVAALGAATLDAASRSQAYRGMEPLQYLLGSAL